MDKKLVNEKALELNNEVLENAMRMFLQEKTEANMERFMEAIRDTRLLVPAAFPKDMIKEAMSKLSRGEKLGAGDAPKASPLIVKNKKNEQFILAFTTKEQFPKDQNYQAMLNMPFREVMRIAMLPELNLKGLLLNPATDNMMLHPQFFERIKNGKAAAPQKKEIKMTKEQFQVFARRNVEWGIFPKNVFTGKAEFINRLEEEREECVAALYRQPYGDKIPCPYTAKDFDVMVLNINEETCVFSIDLPEKNVTPQTALALYIIWNPRNDEMHYYLIEKGQPNQENVLSCITPDGKHQELQTAPSAGSELVTILDLLREEAEENASS